jgi:hypothetical protein
VSDWAVADKATCVAPFGLETVGALGAVGVANITPGSILAGRVLMHVSAPADLTMSPIELHNQDGFRSLL